MYVEFLIFLIGSLLLGMFLGQKVGRKLGIEKVLDAITDNFQEEAGQIKTLENQIKGTEILLNSSIEFFDFHKNRMNDEEKTWHLKGIRQYTDEINKLKELYRPRKTKKSR